MVMENFNKFRFKMKKVYKDRIFYKNEFEKYDWFELAKKN